MNRFFKYALMLAFVGIAIFALNQMSDGAEAADVVWDGGGADNLASTNENWVGNIKPTDYDTAVFDSTSNKNCVMDIQYGISIDIRYGYNGNIYQNITHGSVDLWFKMGSGNYYQNALHTGNAFDFHGGTYHQNNELNYLSTLDIGNTTFICNGYLNITSEIVFDKLIINSNALFISSAQVSEQLIINGPFSNNIYYNGTIDITTNQQHWTGWLYTQNDIAIEYNSYAYLEFNHDAWLGIQMNSWSGTDNFTWNATSVASQTVQWSWSRGESSAMYDEYMDTIYIGSDETNAGGMGEFTSTFVGTHAFLLSRSSFLPASTDISDDVWMAILFMSIATIINFVGYIKKIGLLQIVSFLILLAAVFTMTDAWSEGWALPTLFVLSNAVLFIMGLMRKG